MYSVASRITWHRKCQPLFCLWSSHFSTPYSHNVQGECVVQWWRVEDVSWFFFLLLMQVELGSFENSMGGGWSGSWSWLPLSRHPYSRSMHCLALLLETWGDEIAVKMMLPLCPILWALKGSGERLQEFPSGSFHHTRVFRAVVLCG